MLPSLPLDPMFLIFIVFQVLLMRKAGILTLFSSLQGEKKGEQPTLIFLSLLFILLILFIYFVLFCFVLTLTTIHFFFDALSFHICVTYVHTLDHVADDFIEDVRSSVAEIMKNPKAKAHGTAAIYGQSQGIPDRSLIGYVTAGYLNAVYDTKPVVSDSTDSKSATLASTNQKKGKK